MNKWKSLRNPKQFNVINEQNLNNERQKHVPYKTVLYMKEKSTEKILYPISVLKKFTLGSPPRTIVSKKECIILSTIFLN